MKLLDQLPLKFLCMIWNLIKETYTKLSEVSIIFSNFEKQFHKRKKKIKFIWILKNQYIYVKHKRIVYPIIYWKCEIITIQNQCSSDILFA